MLLAVLLGIRSADKETLGRSAAEMIYGMTLCLPGDFTENYTVDANTNLENYSDKLRVAMSPCHVKERPSVQNYDKRQS